MGLECRPAPVVTEAEIEAEKQRMRAINTRPIKKVAEAKARKKKRLQARPSLSCLRVLQCKIITEPAMELPFRCDEK